MDEVFGLIGQEEKRQQETLTLIPSENYASRAVREAMGSVFGNKYAEGYPGKRYYQGNSEVDKLENLCRDKAKKIFGVPFVNVQPLSGSPANLAILKALKESNKDIQLSQLLQMGGHLSMGQDASITSEYMDPVHYGITPDGEIDWEELERLVIKHKPRVIWSGGTAYTRIFQWEKYAKIADKVGAYFVADISHIGGLVAGGVHPSPVTYAHVVMTTTHKTLRGPRGAMIMVTQKGLDKDANLAAKIDKAVFPGVQGGPHLENVAALTAALSEAASPEFKTYSKLVVKNADVLAKELQKLGYKLVGDGTQNHLIWIDLSNKNIDGWTAAWGLEFAGIITNRQTIPNETKSSYYPSGLRMGTPAVSTRGMKEAEMRLIAHWIDASIQYTQRMILEKYQEIGGNDKILDQTARKKFKEEMSKDENLLSIKTEVKELCERFPLPK